MHSIKKHYTKQYTKKYTNNRELFFSFLPNTGVQVFEMLMLSKNAIKEKSTLNLQPDIT